MTIQVPTLNQDKTCIDENMKTLIEKSKNKLKAISFLNNEWDSNTWKYKKTNIHFSSSSGRGSNTHTNRTNYPEKIAHVAKSHVIELLHKAMLSKNLPVGLTVTRYINGYNLFIKALSIHDISDLNQAQYDKTLAYALDTYPSAANIIDEINRVVHFVNKHYLLSAPIIITPGSKYKTKADYDVNAAHHEKMPEKELVKGIINLRHEIYDSNNNDKLYSNDKLIINTQPFQYGMGMRIGEVLRLPVDCIKEIDGEKKLMVWVEKGQEPFPKPIPDSWLEVILDTIEEVKSLTSKARAIAKQLEKDGVIHDINKRISQWKNKKENDVIKFKNLMHSFLERKKEEVSHFWLLSDDILGKEYLTSSDLAALKLPLKFHKHTIGQCLKKREIPYWVEPLLGNNTRSNFETRVRTENIQAWVNKFISDRAHYITINEFTSLLLGKSPARWENKLFLSKLQALSSAVFYPSRKHHSGVKAISLEHAVELFEIFIGGNYNFNEWIPVQEYIKIIPETGNSAKLIRENCKTKKTSCWVYSESNTGKANTVKLYKNLELINISSVHEYLLSQFSKYKDALTTDISDIKSTIKDGVPIESSSFKINQKVSDYLFLSFNNNYGIVPRVLTYGSIFHFFNGMYKEHTTPSAFERYDIKDEAGNIVNGFQSHKGRHWKTTSLFRAGASDFLVDLLMGRTPGQGRNYDHNTGTERAHIVKKLLLEHTDDVIGPVAKKILAMRDKGYKENQITEWLENKIDVVHWTPYGLCIRNVVLNPCPYNVRCIMGESGEGCKHFALDKKDNIAVQFIVDIGTKSEKEIPRLERMQEDGNIHITKHIQYNKNISENCKNILQQLNSNNTTSKVKSFPNGSSPDDDPFQK